VKRLEQTKSITENNIMNLSKTWIWQTRTKQT